MANLEDIVDKLSQLESDIKKKASTVPSWLLPAAISASVALLTALFVNFLLGPKDHLEHIRGIADTKGKIISACREKNQQVTANLYLTYELKPLYVALDSVWSIWPKPASEEYTSFVAAVQQCRLSVTEPPDGNPAISPESAPSAELPAKTFNADLPDGGPVASIVIPGTEEIRTKFYSAERLIFSDELVRKAAQDRNGIAKALVGAVLPAQDAKSYRINLYIALTLARMRQGWPASADPNGEIEKLRTPNTGSYRDPTFKRRVDEAISNRVS